MEKQTFEQVKETIMSYGEIVATLTAAVSLLIPALQALYDTFWQAYLKAGAPYGETHEGMIRWIEENNHYTEQSNTTSSTLPSP